MTAEFWFNEYLMPDGRQVRCWAGETRREAVRIGGHVQGLIGALVVLRWRVVPRLPAVFDQGVA
ncbi:hypothetical protein [uncultured Variovorax sp.]|uniref:hypothetical protein n=1 Tax=uncultured Variovorax sp. TaxID=114708 RepID=UPI002604E764|nr:hypothetical protein [uncultured Variovorax sp.]